jgi:hypothetical protein
MKVDRLHHWDVAEADCKSRGSHLASIHSLEEDIFIYNLFPEDEDGYRFLYWLGGTDAAIEVVTHTYLKNSSFAQLIALVKAFGSFYTNYSKKCLTTTELVIFI